MIKSSRQKGQKGAQKGVRCIGKMQRLSLTSRCRPEREIIHRVDKIAPEALQSVAKSVAKHSLEKGHENNYLYVALHSVACVAYKLTSMRCTVAHTRRVCNVQRCPEGC